MDELHKQTNEMLRMISIRLDNLNDILKDLSYNYYAKACNEAKGDRMVDPQGEDYD